MFWFFYIKIKDHEAIAKSSPSLALAELSVYVLSGKVLPCDKVGGETLVTWIMGTSELWLPGPPALLPSPLLPQWCDVVETATCALIAPRTETVKRARDKTCSGPDYQNKSQSQNSAALTHLCTKVKITYY